MPSNAPGQYAVYAVQAAGGTVDDLTQQIGVLIVQAPNANFATLLQQYAVIDGYAVIESVSRTRASPAAGALRRPRKWRQVRSGPARPDGRTSSGA